MIDAGSPPDLVLDLSHGGLTSEVSESESSIVSRVKPDLRRVGDHGDFQLKFLVFEHYASLK